VYSRGVERPKIIKAKKFAGDLAFHSPADGEPVDLIAYRLAHRLFWYQAVHGGSDSLQTLYERIRQIQKSTPDQSVKG